MRLLDADGTALPKFRRPGTIIISVLVTTMIFAAGCNPDVKTEQTQNSEPTQESDPGPAPKSQVPSVQGDSEDQVFDIADIKFDLQGLELGKYLVKISWPRLAFGKTLRFRSKNVLAETVQEQTYFAHEVAHNQVIAYSVDVLDASKRTEKTFIKEITIPKDKIGLELIEQNIKVQIVPGEPKKYTLQFSWPQMLEDKSLRIRTSKVLTEMPAQSVFFSHLVDHSQVINYYFDVLDDKMKIEKTILKSIKVPVDFVFDSSNQILSNDVDISVNRLFVSGSRPIYTNGYQLNIKANEVYSNDGVIYSFAQQNKKAGSSMDGRSGGSVFIQGNTLKGPLKIQLSGQDGGDGQNGAPFADRAQAGSPSQTGYEECKECQGRACLTNFEIQSNGCRCIRTGEPATNGANGESGRAGGRAGHGGDSGSAKIFFGAYEAINDSKIRDPNIPPVQITLSAGSPGVPGKGSEGQIGGLGGVKNPGSCSGPSGSDGRNGEKGPDGSAGAFGKIGSSCLMISSEKINECQ